MKTRLSLRSLLFTAVMIVTLAVPWVVFADNVVNNIDTTVDSTLELRTITAGSSTDVGFYIQATTGGGDANGCNATGNDPAYFTVTPPTGVTVTWTGYPNPIQFVGCDNLRNVTFSSNTPGTYTIDNFSMTGGKSGSQWNFAPAAFTLVVEAVVTDTTPPTASPTQSPAANANGWNNTDVTITWNWADEDGGSGIDTDNCTVSTVATAEGEYDVTATCKDLAGNEGTASYGVKIDKTAPTISAAVAPPAALSGWWNLATGAPTVTFTCDDATSGIASCTDPYTFGEGENQSYTGTAVDNAGNSASATVEDIDVDLTAPVVTVTPDRVPDNNGWYNAPVIFTIASSDATAVCDDPVTYSGPDGTGLTVSGSCTDSAGNVGNGTSDAFAYDATAPTITADVAPDAAASGWWNLVTGAPTVTFTCDDATSGIASCTAPYTFPEGTNQSYTGTAVDNAGNSASAAVEDIDVDLTAPGITWSNGPVDGGSYYFGFVPAEPTCTATDTLSGPDGCTVTGYGATVGTHTLTAKAYDVAGNETVETRTYEVLAWTLKGFFQPVNMSALNTVKGGSTVPLKFEIFAGETELTDVAAVKSFTARPYACEGGVPEDPVDFVTTGGTSLRYDWTAGQFIQNWQTPKQPGKCYLVTMTAQDGSALSASFKLK